MKIKAVLLDLDDTLSNTKALYEGALQECHKAFNLHTGMSISYEEFLKLYERAKVDTQITAPYDSSKYNRALYFQNLVEGLKLVTDYQLVHKLYHAYYDYVYANMKPFPEATKFLEWLKESGRKVIVVSNGNAHVRLEKIHAMGISSYIDHMVTSEEVGVAKPAPQMYLLGLNKSNLLPHEVIMIGNRANSDIYGANKLGIITVRTDQSHRPGDDPQNVEHQPRYTVDNLLKVKDIINYHEGDHTS